MTATLHSEQYRRRRAFSSSVSASVSASGSASGSGSGSDGEPSSAGLSSPPATEGVSGATAAVLLGTLGEVAGAGVSAVRFIKDARGCASLSTGESGRGAAPGPASAERKHTICLLNHTGPSII